MMEYEVVIIGAGPAGLAVAGRLSQKGFEDYVIVESSSNVGNSWRHHYDRLHLHTVKQWSHLPHKEFPDEYPLYVPRDQVVKYLEDYAEKFNIQPLYETEVKKIIRNGDQWKIQTNNKMITARHVVMATGVNRSPRVPSWKGDEGFSGTIVHSRKYKNPLPFIGKKVLIIGMGNTGAEIAFDLSESDIEVYLSVRSPISLVPRDLNGQPVQVTAKRLDKLPFGLGDWLGSQIRKIYFGNLEKYGLQISKMHPAVQLKETGKTPVIDIGTIAAIKAEKIKVCPDVKEINDNMVTFKDDSRQQVDAIILATGYTADLSQLIPDVVEFLDNHDLPSGPIAKDKLENLYFIGYDNYKLGGILGTILSDSELIVSKILNK